MSPASLIFRGITLRGFWLARWFRLAQPAARAALFEGLADAIASGALHATVQATYVLADVAAAVEAAAMSGRDGKVVLLPNGRGALSASSTSNSSTTSSTGAP